MDGWIAMSGYTKLYANILRSTIWMEDDQTRIVWITLLAMADASGFVEASVPGIAHQARVPLAKCRRALEKLQEPDPDSKDSEHEGRRIEHVYKGFRILNYLKYRETPEQIRNAERQRRFRARHRGSDITIANAQAVMDALGETAQE